MQLFSHERMWRRHPLKDRYGVVIIGGGVHGLASAYYLAKSGVTNVAVIEQGSRSVEVRSPIDARVAGVLVRDGEPVLPGQPIVWLDEAPRRTTPLK